MEESERALSESRCTRNVALRVCYDGRGYHGLVIQPNEDTISSRIVSAMVSAKLVDDESIHLCFSGRTDKGVSASAMVVSSRLNSYRNGPNYDVVINNHLPSDIRVTGWCYVNDEFSARHSCKLRTYKYLFLTNGLDIAAMERACEAIKNGISFENLSKRVKTSKKDYYIRPIKSINISCHGYYATLDISSISFLQHMVRKIFFAIEQVGLHKENMEFIHNLLWHDNIKCGTESPYGLLFYEATYNPPLEFKRTKTSEDRNWMFRGVMEKLIYKDYYSDIKNYP